MERGQHNCEQGTTLEIICKQLVSIEKEIKEIKDDQKEYLKKVNEIEIEIASRPTAEEQKATMAKVQAHDIYFAIMAVVLGGVLTLIIGIASGYFQHAFGWA
jgi:anaerobic C4-dicarboxylate transporter